MSNHLVSPKRLNATNILFMGCKTPEQVLEIHQETAELTDNQVVEVAQEVLQHQLELYAAAKENVEDKIQKLLSAKAALEQATNVGYEPSPLSPTN